MSVMLKLRIGEDTRLVAELMKDTVFYGCLIGINKWAGIYCTAFNTPVSIMKILKGPLRG